MSKEYKDAVEDLAMEDSGIGSSCSSSVSDALPEPLDNILDGEDAQSNHESDSEDLSLLYTQVSIKLSDLWKIICGLEWNLCFFSQPDVSTFRMCAVKMES